ncbi:MAG: CHASE2 domain-containing protein, partial [Candidatus Rokuibacteriota bacterium]
MKTVALAAMLGLAATAVAAGVAASGNAAVTAFEWSAYERWLRAPEPAGPVPVIVVRDAASESRFGTGAWDRAVLASLVTSLAGAGAAVIGLDAPLGQPSAPGRGGASSDALLSQAIALAENVALPIVLEPTDALVPGARDNASPALPQHRSWLPVSGTSQDVPRYRPLSGSLPGFAQYAKGVGHTLESADPGAVARRVPLLARVGDRRVPAYGLALAAAFTNVDTARIPVDRHGQVLVPAAGSRLPRSFMIVPFIDVVSAIEQRQPEPIQSLVADRIVVLLVEPAAGANRMYTQAHLLDRILAGAWLRETPTVWTVLGSVLLSALAAWLWLAASWWKAAIATAVLALSYVMGVFSSASLTGLLLPLAIPLAAMAVSPAGAVLWNQLTSAYRVRHLEGEVAAIREGLVRQESVVEALEEDLEAARAAVARSTGGEESLRAQLATARAQEEQTRARLEELERRARTWNAADVREAPLGNAEQERLQRECERLSIVTRDPGLLAQFRDLEKAARSVLPVLLAGEPGTGKELFARAAHR